MCACMDGTRNKILLFQQINLLSNDCRLTQFASVPCLGTFVERFFSINRLFVRVPVRLCVDKLEVYIVCLHDQSLIRKLLFPPVPFLVLAPHSSFSLSHSMLSVSHLSKHF